MDYYTASQAAQYLGKTEKTIRKWIGTGKLPATSGNNERNIRQWQIAQSDLDALTVQPEDTSNTSTGTAMASDTGILSALVARVEHLEQETEENRAKPSTIINDLREHVEALDARVHQLETYLHAMTAKPPVNVPTAVHAVPARAESDSELGMPLTEAAALVGLSRRQLSEILKTSDQGQQYHTAIPTNRTDGQVNRYMTYDQIESFKAWRAK